MQKKSFIPHVDFEGVKKAVNKLNTWLSDVFSRFARRKITVLAEVQGVEKVEDAKQKIETLPKTKMVEVQVEKTGDLPGLSGTEAAKPTPAKTAVPGLPDPPVEKWSKMNGIFQSLRSGFRNFTAGLKHASDVFISSGGGAMVLIEGFKSLIKIGQHFYGEWINGMKEAASMSEQNASSIREAAQANEELRQKGDSYLAQLEQIASRESLSNANKAEAKKAIGELTKAYGDLGIKLDETTGKLTGVDSAMIKKAEKDKSRRIKELDAEQKELQNANAQQAELRDKAGVPVWFGGNVRLGGKETSEAAAKQIAENNKRIAEIMRQRKVLMDSDPAGELRAKKEAETARQEEEYKRRQRAFEDRRRDDEFAAETDPAKKIANRQFMLDRHRREVLDPLRKKIAAAEERVKNTTGDDRTEAQRILTQLKSEELSAKEKSYIWEKQIGDIRRKTGNSVPEKGSGFAARPEKENRPAVPSDQGKNAKPGNPPRDPDPKPESNHAGKPAGAASAPAADGASLTGSADPKTKEENSRKQSVVPTGKKSAMPSGQKGNPSAGNPAQVPDSIPSKKAGQSASGSVSAPAANGVSLTRGIRIPYSDSGMPSFNLPGKTNDLISRSIFGAAVVPDKDKYNMQIAAENKAMHAILQRIESMVSDFGKF